MKFLDGSPVDPEYLKAVSRMISDACAAEEEFGLDELEAFAEEQIKCKNAQTTEEMS